MMTTVPTNRPRQDAVRRRRAALATLALAALAIGAAIGGSASGGGGPAPRPARAATAPAGVTHAALAAVDRLSLEQQVGQVVILRFAGTTVPGYVRRALHRRRAAGAILFRDNVLAPAQATALTASLRRAAGRPGPIVCVDQEGGAVRILSWAPPAASEPEQDALHVVGADARGAAEELRREGITVALAPVADVPSVAGAALDGRAFSSDARRTAADIRAAVHGWRTGGVAPTLKHFPGLGGTTVNTDAGPATIDRTRAQLQRDLRPFRAGIAAGAPAVMVSSAIYPALDPGRIASQSPAVVQDLLRRRLGFTGVAMTDSIEAGAVRATGDVEVASVAALRAGIDLVLTTGRGSYIHVYRALLEQARADPSFRARVRESAARVLALRGAR
jgi:beta-N-acetylhexosaminidase